ncbi:hypothetical protein MCOR25_004391 [Pyricularia grisea]|nr:hypothetical protein MCOR25_004391 [Pyricularia grisea]
MPFVLGREQSVGVRLGGSSMVYVDIRRAVSTALHCGDAGNILEGLQVLIERHEGKDLMHLRIAGEFDITEPVATAAIHGAIVALNPFYGEHLKQELISPAVVGLCNIAELEQSPLGGKVIEVLDRRILVD